MSPWFLLALVALVPLSQSTNPGVKVKLTQRGLEYGRQIGMASLQRKLKSIKVPDLSGTEKVAPIGKVKYSLTGMQIVNLGLPKSAIGLVPGTGISLSVGNAFISLRGNWRVRYLRFIKDSGTFDLAVSGLTISAGISLKSDETGHPAVSCASCAATVGSANIKFHGGASWLYNLFSSFIDKALRSALQKQICPLVSDAISEMNPHLKTLNVLAKVDQYAEIEYSMVTSPAISKASIDFSLKGEFYNIGKHQEPPFSAAPFSLPAQSTNMMYIGVSSFTTNSAGFVYNNAGALSLYITDDMIPASSPIRLNTRTFGAFIPQIAKRFPGLMMKLLVKTSNAPNITFEPNNVTLQATGTVTAYAIQPNSTLEPLFILNMDASVSARVYVTGVKLAGAVALNRIDMTLGTSYVGPFQVKSLDNILLMVLKVAVIPKVNARLQQGYPLPAIGKMNLINTQLLVQKDYMLIGTDVHFTE
ncbi:bactericidal permeability-increasing protein-like [Megalops cyprinoides]|uniref:bactericidal permeability-increasing protein-like n=1 Tax=Megalops cyprinoides TaxID=118141 RepID=UPI0018650887|nr:bactericidal permeability-increasing protein-like [Megalops cyprinoides]